MQLGESKEISYCMLSLKQKKHKSCIYLGKAFSLLKVVRKGFVKSDVLFIYCSGCLIEVAKGKKVIHMILTTEYSAVFFRFSLGNDTGYLLLGLIARLIQKLFAYCKL